MGDWEADIMMGKSQKKGGGFVTADERKSKVRVALALPNKQANTVKKSIIGMLKPLRKFVKTITYDNSKEFVQHQKIANSDVTVILLLPIISAKVRMRMLMDC